MRSISLAATYAGHDPQPRRTPGKHGEDYVPCLTPCGPVAVIKADWIRGLVDLIPALGDDRSKISFGDSAYEVGFPSLNDEA